MYGNSVVPVNSFNSVLEPLETYSTVGNSANNWLLYIVNYWNTNGALGSLIEGYGPAVTWGNMSWRGTSFGYDGLNRLTGAQDSGWIRNFRYDEFGNMSVDTNGNYNVPLNGLTPYYKHVPSA